MYMWSVHISGNNVLSRKLATEYFPHILLFKKPQLSSLSKCIHSKCCVSYKKVSKDNNRDLYQSKYGR